MSPDDLGPLYPPQPPAQWKPPVIDAKFKVVLSPWEKRLRRARAFEVIGGGVGSLIAAALCIYYAPDIRAFFERLDAPLIAWLSGSPKQ